jgi:multidrug efflux pump subunit AcrB
VLITVIICGLSAFYYLPRMEDPSLISRAATITTLLPGADAERVEALITEKLEHEILSIEDIKEITSSSRTGVSVLGVELRDQVDAVRADQTWSRIRSTVADAARLLPPEASKPDFNRLDLKAFAMLIGLRWDQQSPPRYAILRRLTKELKTRMDAIPGTERTDLIGDPGEEVLITISSERAAGLQLSASEISKQIELADAKIAAGVMRNGDENVSFEVSGELDTLTRVGNVPIRIGENAQVVALSDFATVERVSQDPSPSRVLLKDRPAVVLAVLVRDDVKLHDWRMNAQDVIDNFEKDLPPGVALEITFDQSPFVNFRMWQLYLDLIFGAIAIYLVTAWLMGLSSATLISLALPLGCLMVLALMSIFGIPMHQISISGLILALGIMIDNAIVVVDEVRKRLDAGMTRFAALNESVRYLAVPLTASTLTTILTFAPVALMPGPTGEFVGSLGTVTILGVLSTLLLSLTVIAALGSMLFKRQQHVALQSQSLFLRLIKSVYRWMVRSTVLHPYLTVIGFLVVFGLSLPLVGYMPEQFFPEADRNQFHIELELPVASSLEQTEKTASQIRQLLLQDKEIQEVAWFLGESAPPFYYNLIPDRKNTPRYAQAIVDCRPSTNIKKTVQRVQTLLGQEMPRVTCLVRQLLQGPPFEAPIEMRIYGPDLEVLARLGDQVRRVLSQTPNVIHTRSELDELNPKIVFELDEEQSKLVGFSNTYVANELNSHLDGVRGGTILESIEELPVRVRVDNQQRGDLSRIASLHLLRPGTELAPGQSNAGSSRSKFDAVPIGSLSRLSLAAEFGGIARVNGQRTNSVQAYLQAGILPSVVQNMFLDRLQADGFTVPHGYSIELAGSQSERDDAVSNLMVFLGPLFTAFLVVLVLSFRSFRCTFLITLVGFLSIGYGILGLWSTNQTWGFMAILGLTGMKGVAINDSVVVLAALQSMTDDQKRNLEAVVEMIMENTRHILATTLTAVFGFIPMIVAGGDFWPPVAISISAGVGGATILSLIFVPCLYFILYQIFPKRTSAKA